MKRPLLYLSAFAFLSTTLSACGASSDQPEQSVAPAPASAASADSSDLALEIIHRARAPVRV